MNMPSKFNVLSDYNLRVSEGIVHKKSYVLIMKKLQKEFHEWYKKDVSEAGDEHGN